jgi:hypothetical protein
VLDHLITAHDEGMIGVELLQSGRSKVDFTVKLPNGYMNYLKRAGVAPGRREATDNQ